MESDRFYDLTRNSRKILVPDLGFLGDTLHLFPALREIREAYPEARLHVMAADHVKDLLQLVPWIDQSWGYPRFPTSPPWYRLLPLIRKLRREHFDAVINLNGSSRSSFLTACTGARFRLGRLPERQKKPLWTRLYTHRVSVPYKSIPVFEQRRICLQQAGIPVQKSVRWDVTIPAAAEQTVARLLEDDRPFIHVSPFTTMDVKELAPEILARVLNEFVASHPEENLVLTCAPNSRERDKLAALLPLLHSQPWKCFAGTLTTLQACALIGKAKLHLGGDSGGVHMAVMQEIPTVVWFKETQVSSGWAPQGPRDVLVCGTADDSTGFLQVDPEKILKALGDSPGVNQSLCR
jgi:ADP-heptose:LPS heptosyltransferase